MRRPYWISWYGIINPEGPWPWEYHGPWWVSGERCLDGAPTICAAVMAEGEDDAKRIITEAHDDKSVQLEWRFVEELDTNWQPSTDENAHFQCADWMKWPWPGVTNAH